MRHLRPFSWRSSSPKLQLCKVADLTTKYFLGTKWSLSNLVSKPGIETHNLLAFFGHGINTPYIVEKLKQSMTVKQNVDLKINPELRTFNTFKDFGTTPPYLLLPISFVQKKFI